MRWLLAAAVLLALPGCLGPSMALDLDCSTNQQTVVAASADLLVTADVPDSMRTSFAHIARISVEAREGQTLTAHATWAAAGGAVNLLYDGPTAAAVVTDRTWTSTGEVSAGTYTLELEGDPMAFEVTYTLHLVASGCTPRDS